MLFVSSYIELIMETANATSKLDELLDWCYGGVDHSIPGNGGSECSHFLTARWRIIESIFACAISFGYFQWGKSNICYPSTLKFIRKDRGGKRLLLLLVSLIFGIEVGFKFATKQLIYLLNPCHITTGLQIYLLTAPPSKLVTTVFRIHMNFLNGAILAMLFPVTNARLLPFEYELYWIEHLFMLVTPYYLLRLGGVYTVEDIADFSWTVMSLGLYLLYHFLPLQIFGLVTQVNLNNMLCPAISDPFYGSYYRIAAFSHQSLCVPIVAKSFCFIANYFITKFAPTKVKDHLATDVTLSDYQKYFNHYEDSVVPLEAITPLETITPIETITPMQSTAAMWAHSHTNGVSNHVHKRSRSESMPKMSQNAE